MAISGNKSHGPDRSITRYIEPGERHFRKTDTHEGAPERADHCSMTDVDGVGGCV